MRLTCKDIFTVCLLGWLLVLFACGQTTGNPPDEDDPSNSTPGGETLQLVSDFKLNGGDETRHVARNGILEFNTLMDQSTIQKEDFAITNITTEEVVDFEIAVRDEEDRTFVEFTFLEGPSVDAVTGLKNGVYRLTIEAGVFVTADGTAINDSFELNADNVREYKFYRLFGDFNGDLHVGFDDLLVFSEVYGNPIGHVKYNPDMDINGDGLVNETDLEAFNDGYGIRIENDQIKVWGDINGNGEIDSFDKLAFESVFDSNTGDANFNAYWDFNEDGYIGHEEYHVLRAITRNNLILDNIAPYGDYNEDDIINFDDFFILRDAMDSEEGDAEYVENVDFDNDGKINMSEFYVFRTVFGSSSSGKLDLTDTVVYGDFDGTLGIHAADRTMFETAYGTSEGEANYSEAIDANLDGVIDEEDLAVFRLAIGEPDYTP